MEKILIYSEQGGYSKITVWNFTPECEHRGIQSRKVKQMKILIDTNIVNDALILRKPWNESTEKIFFMAANNIIDMYITASFVMDIYYLIRKQLHNKETARQIMGKLYSLVGVLEVKEEDLIDALASPITDYEDAVVEQVAGRSDMECIVTRNQKDYEAGLTKIFLSEDFTRFMGEE